MVAGQAAISASGNALDVNALSSRSIINWESFNVGAGNVANFHLPDANSAILNRVTGANMPSTIAGTIQSNGHVMLVNPSGIMVTQSGLVNTNGFTASTFDVTNQDFMDGGPLRFIDGGGAAITNSGTIVTGDGGAHLIANEIANHGTIQSNGGNITLSGGGTMTLENGVTYVQPSLQTLASGISPTAGLIQNTGTIRATGAATVGGEVYLANPNGRILHDGTIAAKKATDTATSTGGRVHLEADQVTLSENSSIDASGQHSGGEVLVGGQWQGSGEMTQATSVVMESGASIDASATESGDGGTIVLWSDVQNADTVTRVFGTLIARAGELFGNGGQIETSGAKVDTAGISVDAGADNGMGGLWLIDPYDYVIDFVAAGNIVSTLNSGTSVTVTTTANNAALGSSGNNADQGDITVASDIITGAMSGDATLTLQAARHIAVDANIDATQNSNTARLNVTLLADTDHSGDGINIVTADSIQTNGGDLTFGDGSTATLGGQSVKVGGDVYITGSAAQSLETAGGDITIHGETIVANSSGGVTFDSGGGDIVFGGLLESGNQYTYVDGPDGQANSWDWARNDAKNGTAGGSAIGDSYMVTITSRLENAIAGIAADYRGSWINAYRPDTSSYNWQWADGPEAGQTFFVQSSSGGPPNGGGNAQPGWYSNFGPNEPNGALDANGETRGQFFGNEGLWNDLGPTTQFSATQDSVYSVLGYVRETNLAATPVTINAGAGAVTMDGSVGGGKSLASLSVTGAAGIMLNGGAINTDGLQTYNSPVLLGNHTHFSTIESDIVFNSTVNSDNIANQWNLTASITPDSTYYWVDWISWDEPTKTATGTITVGSDVITVTYHNPQGIFGAQVSGGTDYWTGYAGAGFSGASPYESSSVANGPSGSDIIQLQYAGSQTLSFSESVENLAFSIVSMNGNGYGFDQDFEIVSHSGLNGAGPGYFGSGDFTKTIVGDTFQLNDGGVNGASMNGNSEPHGTIRFGNAFSQLTWESLSDETWNGFTVGISGTSSKAGTVHFNGLVGDSVALGDVTVNAGVQTTADLSAASSFNVSGLASLGGSVTTTGDQSFGSAVTLGTDLALTTTANGNIDAISTIDGAHDLAVQTNGTGDVDLGGDIGGTAPLTDLTITTDQLGAKSIALAASSALGVTVGGTSQISGVISGADVTVAKSGVGDLGLGAINTYGGSTTINDGILSLAIADALPDTTDLIVGASGTFSLNGFDETVGSISGSGLIVNGAVVRPGLVLWLDAGNESSYDGTGNVWHDLSGNDYDAEIFGNPTYDGATSLFSFETNSQYVKIEALPADFLGTTVSGVTVFTVANFGNTSDNWERVVDLGNVGAGGNGPNDNIILSRYGTTDRLNWEIYTGSTLPGAENKSGTNTAITNNVKSSFAGTADGTNLRIFKDGILNTTTAETALPNPVARNDNYIGKSNWTLDDTFRGDIGTLMIYDRALSEAEIATNHQVLFNRADATLTVGGNNSNTNFSGSIENGVGTLNLVKMGTGTTTLSGANNYSGTTTINAGTLQIGNGGTTGTLGLGNVSDNSHLVFDRSDNIAFSGNISGTGDLEKFGAGDLTLHGMQSYTGATTIHEGTLIYENDALTLATSGIDGPGLLTIRSASDSFSSSFSTSGVPLGATTALGGLTIGKTTNTSFVTLGDANVNGPVNLYGGYVTVGGTLDTSGGGAGGDVLVKALDTIFMSTLSTITTSGGDVTFWADSNADSSGAILLNRNTVMTGGGNITLGGGVDPATGNAIGMSFYNNGISLSETTLNAAGGNISLRGIGNPTQANNARGVYLTDGSSISTTGSGTITIAGTGGGIGGGDVGVYVEDSVLSGGTSGDVLIDGTGGGDTLSNSGVLLSGATISTAGANLQITGLAGGGTGGTNRGVQIGLASEIGVTGGGTLTIQGTGTGNGGANGANQGINVYGAGNRITAESGSINLVGIAGDSSGFQEYGIYVDSNAEISGDGAVSLTGTGGPNSTQGLGLHLGTTGTLSTTSLIDPLTLTADSIGIGSTFDVDAAGGNGQVTIQNRTAGTAIYVGTSDSLTGPLRLGLTSTELNRISANQLTIRSNPDQAASDLRVAGNTSLASITNLSLQSATDLNVYAALGLTGSGTISLDSQANINGSPAAAITANQLEADATGTINLTATNNDLNTVALNAGGTIFFADSDDLTIGTVNSTSGITSGDRIFVDTNAGDLTIAQNIASASTSSIAIMLNAGKNSSAGTATGGNIIMSGTPSITTGSGGKALLLTGSVADSTGLTDYLGSGSNRFRYNSDELSFGFSQTLLTGVSALYREQPTITVAVDNQSMVYASTTPALTFATSGYVNGDTQGQVFLSGPSVSVGGATSTSGNYTVGSHTLTGGGVGSLGYAIASGDGTLTVSPITLAYTGTANDKTYDGTNVATMNHSATGIVSGDVIGFSANAVFSDKNVGTDKAVSITGLGLSGADAGNYTIDATSSDTANITPRTLTVSGISANDKVYDSTTAASLDFSGLNLGGLVSGDDITVNNTQGAFDTKQVGTGKTVTLSGSTYGGADLNNYLFVDQTSASADITPLQLFVDGLSANDKVYDSTLVANLSGNASINAIVGDEVNLLGAASALFADANAGNAKAVSVNGFTLSGADASNYQIQQPTGLTADIQKATLSVVANDDGKIVTQSDVSGYLGAQFDGFVGGEGIGDLTGSLTITRPGMGIDEAAGTYADALVAGGLTSNNYDIQFTSGDYTILPADELLVRFDNTSTIYGNAPTFSLLSAQYLDSSDSSFKTLTNSGSSNFFDLSDGVGGTAQFDAIAQGAGVSSGGTINAGNYQIGAANLSIGGGNFLDITVLGKHSVKKAPLTVSSSGYSKVYDGSTAMPGLTFGLSGIVTGDDLNVSGIGQLATRHVGTGIDYVVSDLQLNGFDASNYFLAGGNRLTGNNGAITPRPINVTAPVSTKPYDGTDAYQATAEQLATLNQQLIVGNDTLDSINLRFDDAEPGATKELIPWGVTISDGNAGANYAVTYVSNFISRILPLVDNREVAASTIRDTNTRYESTEPQNNGSSGGGGFVFTLRRWINNTLGRWNIGRSGAGKLTIADVKQSGNEVFLQPQSNVGEKDDE